ncbi:MAG: hypothetical protein ABL916_21590 [Burkholderiaceae bacterium]
MKLSPIAFVVGCALASGATYWAMNGRLQTVFARVGALENEVSVRESELLGYTKYTSYLTVGKQSLGEQTKLITASVVRDEGITQVIEKSTLGFSTNGTVQIWHKVEYSFGFDLRAGSYDIQATPTGIEVRVGKPVLVVTPAVTDLKYKILSGALFGDEKGAVLRLYEEASRRATEQGRVIATEPATIALCEKKLTAFLHDFLAKQPGVKVVPTIVIAYK